MKVTLLTFWGWRSDADGPELLVAWDEYSHDENPGGFAIECESALARNDIRADRGRHIHLVADYDVIEQAFWPVETTAEVATP